MTYTYELKRRRAYFTRYGIGAQILRNGAPVEDTPGFHAAFNDYGVDGRKVRANVIAWAKRRCAELNREKMS